MAVQATDHLIQTYLKQKMFNHEKQRDLIIKPITKQFTNQTPLALQSLLLNHGLFQPSETEEATLEDWLKHDLQSLIRQHFDQLKKEWQGPDVRLFILPVDFNNKIISDSFNGVTGLSFARHVFLFLNHSVDPSYIKAILAHEYSHSYRLNAVHRKQNLITLKDSLILEGIAEVITQKKYAISFLSKNEADEQRINKQFNKWIEPNLSIRSNHPLHHMIMYGGGQIDQRAGYKAGAYIVKNWLAKHPVDLATLLKEPTESFFKNEFE